MLAIFSQINCEQTLLRVSAERAALEILDGSCHTPVGAHATLENGHMILNVAVAVLDGSKFFQESLKDKVRSVSEAEKIGRDLGAKVKALLPPDILQQRIA